MQIRKIDVAVIGAGSAGLGVFHEARKAEADALLIESGVYGITCAQVGCMPSKLLIAAAQATYGAHQADGFGVRVGSVSVDGEAVMERVRAECDGDKVVVFYTRLDNQKITERFDYALAATGRSPNIDRMDLKKTGVKLDDNGVPVFDRILMQCGNAPIFWRAM